MDKYCWFTEDDVSSFIKGFIIKACEYTYTPEAIGEYLALALDGLIDAQKERELKED